MRHSARRPCSTCSRLIRWRGQTRGARWRTWWRGTNSTGREVRLYIGMPLTHHVMCNTGIRRRKHFPINILHAILRDFKTHAKECHAFVICYSPRPRPLSPWHADSYFEDLVLFVYEPEPVWKSEPESSNHERERPARVWFKMTPLHFQASTSLPTLPCLINYDIKLWLFVDKQSNKLTLYTYIPLSLIIAIWLHINCKEIFYILVIIINWIFMEA